MSKSPHKRGTIAYSVERASEKWKAIWAKRAAKKRTAFAYAAQEFAHKYKDSFVMLADPDTDVILMAYQNILVPMRYTNPKDGSRMRIVANALSYSQGAEGERSVDQYLLAVDSGIVAIANELYNRRRKSLLGKATDAVLGVKPKTIEPKANPFSAKEQ